MLVMDTQHGAIHALGTFKTRDAAVCDRDRCPADLVESSKMRILSCVEGRAVLEDLSDTEEEHTSKREVQSDEENEKIARVRMHYVHLHTKPDEKAAVLSKSGENKTTLAVLSKNRVNLEPPTPTSAARVADVDTPRQELFPIDEQEPCVECTRRKQIHGDEKTSCLRHDTMCTRDYCCGHNESACSVCDHVICNKCLVRCRACQGNTCVFRCARFIATRESYFTCVKCSATCDACQYQVPKKCLSVCKWCNLRVCEECDANHNKLPGHTKCSDPKCARPCRDIGPWCLEHEPAYCANVDCFARVCRLSGVYCETHWIDQEWNSMIRMLLQHHYGQDRPLAWTTL